MAGIKHEFQNDSRLNVHTPTPLRERAKFVAYIALNEKYF